MEGAREPVVDTERQDGLCDRLTHDHRGAVCGRRKPDSVVGLELLDRRPVGRYGGRFAQPDPRFAGVPDPHHRVHFGKHRVHQHVTAARRTGRDYDRLDRLLREPREVVRRGAEESEALQGA